FQNILVLIEDTIKEPTRFGGKRVRTLISYKDIRRLIGSVLPRVYRRSYGTLIHWKGSKGSIRWSIQSTAIGRIGRQRPVQRRRQKTNKKHFVQKDVSRRLFLSTFKSGRPSPEEKIKINSDALTILRPT
ncbi:hypothetical protein V1478_005163, partial [Vespula squamosa]